MASKSALLLSLSTLFYLSIIAHSNKADCVYTVYIKTGDIFKAGTDSVISMTLYTTAGDGVWIRNLKQWGGLMGHDYDYFERGNLDIFSGKGPCLGGPVCSLNLTSSGKGLFPSWYCNYVDVTTTGNDKNCEQAHFTVEQWLTLDSSPYELSAILHNCSSGTKSRRDLVRSSPRIASATLKSII